MMKSSTLFQCGPPTFTSSPPDVIHMISVPMPSHSSAFVHYTECKLKNKTQGMPGNEARDDHDMFCVYAQPFAVVVATVRMVEVPA